MNVLMTEWDRWVDESEIELPLFRKAGHTHYAFLNEVYAMLDLCRLADAHYQYNPRVLCVTILYIKLIHRICAAGQLDYRKCNMLFNGFLGGHVDLCFEGLNFSNDMQPCLEFASKLNKVSLSALCTPLVANYKRSVND